MKEPAAVKIQGKLVVVGGFWGGGIFTLESRKSAVWQRNGPKTTKSLPGKV